MPSGNWVAAREKCSIPAQFEFLCKTVQTNVGDRNKLRRQPQQADEFRFDLHADRATAVVTRTDGARVTISIAGDGAAIEIRGHTDRKLDLAVMLDDDLQCRLAEIGTDGVCVPGTERPAEAFSRIVLDRLFFDSGSDVVRRR